MNWSQDRFQAYAEDFDIPDRRQTQLSDITKIDKIPIYSITAEVDGLCEELDTITAKFDTIPSFERQTVMMGFNHGDFGMPSDTQRDTLARSLLDFLDEIYAESTSGSIRVASVAVAALSALFVL